MSIQPFIKCSDIAKSIEFYTHVLDFKVVQAPDPNPKSFMSKYAFLERDGSYIHLSMHEGDGVFGNLIYINVDDVGAIAKKVSGVQIGNFKSQTHPKIMLELVSQTWGMKEFGVSDPDGNKITYGQKLSK